MHALNNQYISQLNEQNESIKRYIFVFTAAGRLFHILVTAILVVRVLHTLHDLRMHNDGLDDLATYL